MREGRVQPPQRGSGVGKPYRKDKQNKKTFEGQMTWGLHLGAAQAANDTLRFQGGPTKGVLGLLKSVKGGKKKP